MLLDPNMVLWMNIIDSSVLIIDSNSFVQFQKQSSSKTGSGLLGAFQLVKVKPNYLYCWGLHQTIRANQPQNWQMC